MPSSAALTEPATPLGLLRQHWGHPQFRPGQQEIVEAVLAGRDALALLPTGGGAQRQLAPVGGGVADELLVVGHTVGGGQVQRFQGLAAGGVEEDDIGRVLLVRVGGPGQQRVGGGTSSTSHTGL